MLDTALSRCLENLNRHECYSLMCILQVNDKYASYYKGTCILQLYNMYRCAMIAYQHVHLLGNKENNKINEVFSSHIFSHFIINTVCLVCRI